MTVAGTKRIETFISRVYERGPIEDNVDYSNIPANLREVGICLLEQEGLALPLRLDRDYSQEIQVLNLKAQRNLLNARQKTERTVEKIISRLTNKVELYGGSMQVTRCIPRYQMA